MRKLFNKARKYRPLRGLGLRFAASPLHFFRC